MYYEFMQAVLANIALIFGLFLLTTVINVKYTSKKLIVKTLMGISIGIATIFVILNGLRLDSGAMYDARTIVIGLAALYFPIITSAIATTIAIAYRIYVGGVGIVAGSLSLLSAFLVGVFWRYFLKSKLKMHPFIQYYLFGLIVHIFVVLAQFTLPQAVVSEIFPIVTPILLGVFPVATLILAIAIQNQIDRIKTRVDLKNSEMKFRTFFDESPTLMILHDTKSGAAIYANKRALQRYEADDIEELNRVIWQRDGDFDKQKALSYIQQALVAEQNFVWRSKDKKGQVFYERVLLRPIVIGDDKFVLAASIDITEKKYFADELEKFKKIVTEAEYGAALVTKEGEISYINEAFARMHGYSMEELIGMNIKKLIPTDQTEKIRQFSREIQDGGRVQSDEVRHLRKDGSTFPVVVSASLIETKDKTFLSLSAVDVSKIKLSEQRYRLVSVLSNTGVWEYHVSNKFLWCSPEYFSMLGFEQYDFYLGDDNIVETWDNLLHPEDLEVAIKQFDDYCLFKPNTMYESQFRLRTKSGEYRWIWSRGSFVHDENGIPTDVIIGTHIDMTDFKKQEQEKKELEHQLELLIVEMPMGLALHEMIYDEANTPVDYMFLTVNDNYETLTGYKKDNILGKTILEINPDYDREWIKTYGTVATTGVPINYEQYDDRLNKHYSVKAYAPKLGQFAVIFEDITERKQGEAKIYYASQHDYLTSLPNRRYFDEKIRELDQPQYYPLVIAMMDIDGLKLINDTLGHFVGDQVIIETSTMVKSVLPKEAFIARIGGDEFMILLPNYSVKEFKELQECMKSAVGSNKINGIEISISFGSVLKTSSDIPVDELLIRAENNMYANKVLHGKSARNQIIVTLFETLKEKYEEERIHSNRVSHYCTMMGSQLNLSESEILELELAGRMHDIGKISIPDSILRKQGKLNEEEWAVMKTHSTYGYQILRTADQYSQLAEYVLSHHEHMDGKGYPQGLKGEAIPLFSRIIAICDAYEAMTSDRQYRKALSNESAIAELIRCSGSQFDAELVELFINKVLNTALEHNEQHF